MSASISRYTIQKLDNVLLDYKKRIIKHFYENFLDSEIKSVITFRELENRLTEYKDNRTVYDNIIYNPKKCRARVWDKSFGFYQCSNGPTMGMFCKKHNSKEKQNYGIVE
jgi:hypothetical protein